jgi:transposase-like protein
MIVTCSHCQSVKVVKNGRKHGKQAYRCKACGRRFVGTGSDREKLSERDRKAIRYLHIQGVSMAIIAKAFAIVPSTVYRISTKKGE